MAHFKFQNSAKYRFLLQNIAKQQGKVPQTGKKNQKKTKKYAPIKFVMRL